MCSAPKIPDPPPPPPPAPPLPQETAQTFRRTAVAKSKARGVARRGISALTIPRVMLGAGGGNKY